MPPQSLGHEHASLYMCSNNNTQALTTHIQAAHQEGIHVQHRGWLRLAAVLLECSGSPLWLLYKLLNRLIACASPAQHHAAAGARCWQHALKILQVPELISTSRPNAERLKSTRGPCITLRLQGTTPGAKLGRQCLGWLTCCLTGGAQCPMMSITCGLTCHQHAIMHARY